MTLQFFAHPFSSYCQKALIAFYENDIPFEWRELGPDKPDNIAEWCAGWPIKRMPVLKHGDRTVMESTIIIEYLQLTYPGPVRLLPKNPADALETRMMDRFFDNYIMTPMQKVVFNAIRPETDKDPYGVDEARRMLDDAYTWLDDIMATRTWAAGEDYSLADCAASPSLFYADWVHAIEPRFEQLRAYRTRLLERPSFARAVDEARPYRSFFPLGAPDRD
ncbi:glutathione S-transferase family protein [Pararhizobium arenae]|uniref:glutathione S-transferase family protein n=1 Tax=Pararhizobium arenae TaxID=1856850 RepID=UPI00094ABBD4|nr:glutathione S-transferase family protein [Pararhizobium arenae]